ncbi:MAG: hypothetical protein ABI759_04415 [Candidatus Solibacter sp.]
MTRARILAGLLVLAAQIGMAADTGQWSNVLALRKGDRIGVIQTNQKRVEGRFESATDGRITINADQLVSVEKADVVRVYEPPRINRVWGAVLGGAIGVAAGAVVDATVGVRFRNEGQGPEKGVITVIGAGAGGGIGAAVSGRYRTVYRVR